MNFDSQAPPQSHDHEFRQPGSRVGTCHMDQSSEPTLRKMHRTFWKTTADDQTAAPDDAAAIPDRKREGIDSHHQEGRKALLTTICNGC
eukprot:3625811-Pyramimonas_sp.AAC.1